MLAVEYQAREKQLQFWKEAQQDAQAEEAQQNRSKQSLKQKLGEKLVNLGNLLAQNNQPSEA
jgi:hypothetical protein